MLPITSNERKLMSIPTLNKRKLYGTLDEFISSGGIEAGYGGLLGANVANNYIKKENEQRRQIGMDPVSDGIRFTTVPFFGVLGGAGGFALGNAIHNRNYEKLFGGFGRTLNDFINRPF